MPDAGAFVTVVAVVPETVANAVNVPTKSSGVNAIDATVAGTNVVVPVDAVSEISLSSGTGTVSIGLPFATQASNARVEQTGVVSYNNNNGPTTVPLLTADGNTQINTVIESIGTPTRYEYPIDIPAGGTVVHSKEDGSVVVFDASDEVIMTVAVPWAKDARGNSAPTRYEVVNDVLTQVVDHNDSFVCPIIADPYVGNGVFYSSAWITNTARGCTVNAVPAAKGRRLNAVNVLGTHLRQLKKILGSQSSKVTPTIREQFYCHVVGNFLEPGTCNMESWRPYKDRGWQLNSWERCNP
ncbi:MAG: hypothetical protein B5766_07450 [Candidatus Lumbricidophila eiseniae]|uniref:DUF2599 domain-containing protein n=1 Tax=Candidatus Lumbricidiphila eiseniae TaxID=1969409 RepID=A0A2A6FRB4_9MICO|nr:MAG: hypothetical protein B5766_07450 [Candidatus Lumbricidophila eiseniae]